MAQAFKLPDLGEGLALAREALTSGRAGERLDELVAFSQAEAVTT